MSSAAVVIGVLRVNVCNENFIMLAFIKHLHA